MVDRQARTALPEKQTHGHFEACRRSQIHRLHRKIKDFQTLALRVELDLRNALLGIARFEQKSQNASLFGEDSHRV